MATCKGQDILVFSHLVKVLIVNVITAYFTNTHTLSSVWGGYKLLIISILYNNHCGLRKEFRSLCIMP